MPVFHYIHLRAFCHETEDPEKVKRALRNASHDERVEVSETVAEGAHGNRIGILEAQAKGSAERALFTALAQDDPRGYARLSREAPRRLDEHLNFHVRLDKQEAFLGRTVLARDEGHGRGGAADAITVRGKVRSFPKPGADPIALALHDVGAFLERCGKSKE